MQKLLNFLLIGLIFTVLQVSNVEAQDTAAPGSAAAGQMDQEGNMNQGDPCMQAPAGPDRDQCYSSMGNQNQHHDQGNMNQGDPCMQAPAGPDRDQCYSSMGNQNQHHDQGNMNQGKPNPGMGNCPSGTKKDFNSDACIKVKKGCPSGTKKDFNSDACIKVKKGCPSGTKKDFNSDACIKE